MRSSNATDGAGESRDGIRICRDLDDLGRRSAGCFIRSAVEAVSSRGRFSAALSGGSTPRTLYQYLTAPSFSDKVPWGKVHLFWGDERAVPPDHPDSNYRTARETLISKVPIPSENVHRMPAERSDLAAAAETYEGELRAFFNPSGGRPSFDLILLGIGADGHTASLFPGSPALEEEKRWVAAVYPENSKVPRLTLTLPVLNEAREIFFLAAGKEKAPVIKLLLQNGFSGSVLPAARVRPRRGRRIYFLEREAAALIDPKEEME